MAVAESVGEADRYAAIWAETYLSYRGHPHARILGVHADCILFVDRQRGPMTAWLRRDPKGMEPMMRAELGFPAEPSVGLWASQDEYDEVAGEGPGVA
jgi:hypothetical protein